MTAQANTNLTVIIDKQAPTQSAEQLEAASRAADFGQSVALRLTALDFEKLPAQLRNRVSHITR